MKHCLLITLSYRQGRERCTTKQEDLRIFNEILASVSMLSNNKKVFLSLLFIVNLHSEKLENIFPFGFYMVYEANKFSNEFSQVC